ncbi:hypothetical protein GCM10019059_01630 [Camelimonas fluminis]|uniref:DUF6065 family protein n=1 Tax=Camelimonas fluminis TaxID=1576911 RepID=A0ABV7UEG4_9HYPH|nr:DUF6065 family protein [Camelimonas fluminis]GHE46735.1 hypothetical protein GCM10019059_01630 [Camelimonas fluminis]
MNHVYLARGWVMKLTGYVLEGQTISVRPAPLERAWMDATPNRFAYRCLPLNIANCHGWEVLCRRRLAAVWDGGVGPEAIQVSCDGDSMAVSHFGSGVLTFHVPVLFRTEPGHDIFVTGPLNRPKDGIAPLTGVIETDWAPYTFTMNWLFTRPGHPVVFEVDEPVCHFFPVARGALEAVCPAFEAIQQDGDLNSSYRRWARERDAFNDGLKQGDPDMARAGWQKAYFRGHMPDGQHGAGDHRSKLRLRAFTVGQGELVRESE